MQRARTSHRVDKGQVGVRHERRVGRRCLDRTTCSSDQRTGVVTKVKGNVLVRVFAGRLVGNVFDRRMCFIRADVDRLRKIDIRRISDAREDRATLIDRKCFGSVCIAVQVKRINRQVRIAARLNCRAVNQQRVCSSRTAVVG